MADLILGYDASDGARAALDTAIALARELGDRIVVAYADAPPESFVGDEWKMHRQTLHEIGEQATKEAIKRIRAAGLEVDVQLVTQKPAQALIELAKVRDTRLIVVGTRGERRIAGALLGSVAHRLVHRSPFPVLVVPARD